MSTGELLSIEPLELKFFFELKKQISCSLQLSNKTDHYVAFKVKTTNPKKYCVRPNTGIVLPRSTCDVIVTMQAQKEAPPDMQCKDNFLLQSVIAPDGATPKDITAEMFNKEAGHVVEECKLRVVYVAPTQPPSLVTEGSEEGSSPRGSVSENGNVNGADSSPVTRAFADRQDAPEKSAEGLEAKMSVIQKFFIASLFMWAAPIGILYGFNHNLLPGTANLSPYSMTLVSGFLAVISVNVVIAFYIYLAMREPADKHEPDPKFLAEARASMNQPTADAQQSSQTQKKEQ